MKLNFILTTILCLTVIHLSAQPLEGIWHSADHKQVIDFTKDGRYKIFGKNFVKYGRYKLKGAKIYFKEIGDVEALKLDFSKKDKKVFNLIKEDGQKITFKYFDESSLTHEEFARALKLYYIRDVAYGVDVAKNE